MFCLFPSLPKTIEIARYLKLLLLLYPNRASSRSDEGDEKNINDVKGGKQRFGISKTHQSPDSSASAHSSREPSPQKGKYYFTH